MTTAALDNSPQTDKPGEEYQSLPEADRGTVSLRIDGIAPTMLQAQVYRIREALKDNPSALEDADGLLDCLIDALPNRAWFAGRNHRGQVVLGSTRSHDCVVDGKPLGTSDCFLAGHWIEEEVFPAKTTYDEVAAAAERHGIDAEDVADLLS